MSNCKDEVCNGRFVPEFSVSALKETISKFFHSKVSTQGLCDKIRSAHAILATFKMRPKTKTLVFH